MDQTVGVVGTGCGVWRGWGIGITTIDAMTCEVWVQNCQGLFLVSHMDHTQSGCCVETIPVCSLGCPRQIVSQECIISCVCVHYPISPECGAMQHRALLRYLLFDLLYNQHITVIVLLEELKIQAVAHLTSEDALELFKALCLLRVTVNCLEVLHNFLCETLTLVV